MIIARRCSICNKVAKMDIEEFVINNPKRMTPSERKFIRNDICPDCQKAIVTAKRKEK